MEWQMIEISYNCSIKQWGTITNPFANQNDSFAKTTVYVRESINSHMPPKIINVIAPACHLTYPPPPH